MAGSLTPLMYWAVRITLCSTLQSDSEQFPFQARDGAAVKHFEDLRTHAKTFQSPGGEIGFVVPSSCLGAFGP
jgi:hypothetical protein